MKGQVSLSTAHLLLIHFVVFVLSIRQPTIAIVRQESVNTLSTSHSFIQKQHMKKSVGGLNFVSPHLAVQASSCSMENNGDPPPQALDNSALIHKLHFWFLLSYCHIVKYRVRHSDHAVNIKYHVVKLGNHIFVWHLPRCNYRHYIL